jgi:Fe-Mn family superoxide dismutase
MPDVQSPTFETFEQCDAISPTTRANHLALYHGYVKKYGELSAQMAALQARGPSAIADISSLKGDITFALGAIKNHQLYFDSLGAEEGQEPTGVLKDLIVKSFHSVPQYLVDLKQTALQGRGWAWTAYDLDQGRLFNFEAGASNGLPVWNAMPLMALDLYGHAYFYDYGNNKAPYIEAVMRGLRWERIRERLEAVRK